VSEAAGHPGSRSSEEAERAFLAHLERTGDGEIGDLDALCRLHPALAEELRELAARWELLIRLRGSALPRVGPAPGAAAEPRPAPLAAIHARLLALGSATDRYRDEGEIARGAQGVVRRTFDATLERHVAMKVLHDREAAPGLEPRSPGSSRRFRRFLDEARVTAQLDHPAIVPVHELGLDAQGAVYFTMKLVQGRSLQDVLDARDGPAAQGWNTTRLLGALERVASAMAFAHDRGVVHRDLKPANVMLGDYGEVYVMDWGLARALGTEAGTGGRPPAESVSRSAAADAAPDSSLHTLEGDVVGTPQYMAPEQAAGQLAQLGPAADVYALGAMLYHVLAGRPPYSSGTYSSPAELLVAVRTRPPVPLDEAARGVPPELEAICGKAMARDAAHRYASMAEAATDLRAFLESRVVRAYEAGPLAELRKWVRRNRALTVAAASALVAVLGGLVWVSLVESDGRRRAEAAQQESDRNLADVLRLSDARSLDQLRTEAEDLWPADPQHSAALSAWLEDARALVRRTDGHRATLEELRTRAEPRTPDDARRDREDPRLAADLAAGQAALARLRPMLAAEGEEQPGGPARRSFIVRKLQAAQAEVDRAQAAQLERRTWRFASREDAWWHATLAVLLDGLRDFSDTTFPSVEQRLRRAQDLERVSLLEPAELWAQAVASIADPAQCPLYGGLHITPQLGLVPLARNERSGLWEFWDVQLGERPVPAADGHFTIAPESGLLFVLMPGGSFTFGAQKADPGAPGYDALLLESRCRLQQVRLDPFFLSACEVTQAQWERAMGSNPSTYPPPGGTGFNYNTESNPVESLTWAEAREMSARVGFTLPTEPQWEYACRAGTTTRWWTGNELPGLQGSANVADVALAATWDGNVEHEPDLDDGHAATAPVGSFRPNGFGLYDMIGNVGEWTRDAWTEAPADAAPGDGGQPGGDPVEYPVRGGSFQHLPEECASAMRTPVPRNARAGVLGLRVARPLRPAGD